MGDKSPIHPASSKISVLWESFINSELNSHERNNWLDLFLGEALLLLKDGKTPVEILSLSGKDVGAVLCEEIVRGVESTCNSDTNATGSTEDDLAPLRNYLLCGPGWRVIALLHQLGIQEVGEELGKELARVLMCVHNVVCSPTPEEATNEYLFISHEPPVDQICRFRLPGRLKSRSASSYGSVGSLPSSLSKPRPSLPRHFRTIHQGSRNESSSDEELLISSSHRNLVEEKNEKQREQQHTEFDPYLVSGGAGVHATDGGEEIIRAASSGWGRRRRPKPCPEDVADWRTHLVIQASCPGSQLALVTLSLLQGICRAEATPAASTQVVTFCLEALCSLQFGAICRPQLQATATRLLLTALDKLLSCPDATLSVLQTGALPMMLRLLEDSISKAQKDTTDPELQQDFIYGVTYAVVSFIHSLVLQCPSPEKMDFETPFQQYLDSYNGRLIECSVGAVLSFKSLNEKMTVNRAKKMIGLVGQLVNCLKQTRTRFVHMRICRRGKHKSCKVSSVIHHHDDVLGEVYKQTVLPGANRDGCRITAVSMSLARFISESGDRELALRAMAAMMECGTCCCFPAQGLIARILRLVQTGDSRARNTGLMLLERTIYKEVGALEDRRCSVCCDNSAAVSKHRWAGLQAFQDMLMSSNIRVAHTVASHLMRVAPRCIITVQKELLFSVFYPSFLASKKNYCETKSDRDKFTLVTCLSAFTNLLGKMRFACEFLERDGLRHIMDLTRHRDFERLACTILEIVTVVRLWKLGESVPNSGLSPEAVPELHHLTSLIVNTTNHFLTYLKKWQDSNNPEDGISFRSTSAMEKYATCLEELNTYWSSCLNLCLFSPQVRAHSTRHLSIHAYTLLTLFIQHISKPFPTSDDADQETNDKYSALNQHHLELLESLITFTTLCPYSGNPGGIKCLEGKLEKVAESRLGLRPVCDVLLRSSGAMPTDKLMLPLYPMPKLNNLDVSLAANLISEEGNSDSSLDSSEDEGYDGDIELTHRNNQDKDSMSNKGSLPPSRKISALGERRYKIVHPSLCHLALDLILYCHRKEGFNKECIYCLHKLSSAVRDSCHNALCLVQSGFALALLRNFMELLSNKSQQDCELQVAVLELFGNLARYCLQPDELATYLQLFVSDQPPVDLLLNILLKLMKGTTIQPKYILCFPAEYSNADLVNSTQAHKMAITLHHQHLSLDVVSCWSRAALFLPLNCDLSWAMWVQGFSLSLWLKLDNPLANQEPPQTYHLESSWESISGRSTLDEINLNQLLHIISIGYEALVLEFWADTIRNVLHIRLTRCDAGVIETLSEASIEGTITCGSWHHLSISVRDSVHNSKVIIEVTLVLDGWRELQIPLSFKGLLVRKSRPTCIILGDTEHAPVTHSSSPETNHQDGEKNHGGTWELGNILMFRRPLLGKEESALLWALGPDACLVSCQAGEPLTVTSPALNHCEYSPTLLPPDIQSVLLKSIQENLLVTYSAKDPNIMNIYPQVSGSTGVGGGFRVVVGGDAEGNNGRSSQQVPMTLPLVTLTSPAPQIQCDIITAIDTLGGPALILFLFARVVELESSEKEQGAALELFLRMTTSFNHQIRSEAMGLVSLVSRVIDTPLCTPGLILLQTVVDCCCQGDVLVYPELLVGLLLEWPGPWAASHALDSLLQTLLSLTKDDHKHREFNSSQLNRANALHTLLNLCKERMLEGLSLSVELCRGVVEVVRSLMTAPPLLSHVSSLSDYLLLSHPAHLTFISHSRQSLSFLLPPDPPSTKSHPSRKKGLFGVDKAYRSLFTKPIDPSKLNQALNKLKGGRGRRGRVRESSGESTGEEILGICDSGIAASSLQETVTDSDLHNGRDVDEWSNTSANTYFTSNAQHFDMEADSPSTHESSVVSSDNEEHSTENNSYVRNKMGWRRGSIGNGEVELVVGLLEVVRDQLLVLPDSVAHCPSVMSSLVNPHCLIAMANHTNHHIVSAVVKVLAAYWERVNVEERARFISDRLFYLLAMQLPHSLTDSGGLDLVEGLAGIVTGYHRSQLSHQVMQLNHDFATGGSQSLTLAALPPLLSLIPSSVTHIPTAHNLISFVHSLFIKVGDWKVMIELGLVEATLKALVRTVHEHDEDSMTDLCIPERNVLIADINSLLSTVISHALHSSGSQFAQVISDFLLQIEFISNSERETCGLTAQCALQIRKTHAAILRAAIIALTDCISSHSTKASFLSSVMSVSSDEIEAQSSSSNSSTLSYSGKLSRSDLNERYKLVISRSTEFFIHNEPNILDDGGDFLKEVWGAIVQALVAVIERKSMHTRSSYSNVAWTNRDVLRTLGSQMFLWMLSPAQPRPLQIYGIQSVLNEPRSKDILSYIISTTLVEESVALYLWEMGKSCTVLNEIERKACDEMSTRLEEWCSPSVLSLFNSQSTDEDYSAHVWSALDLSTRTRNTWRAQRNNIINKVVYRHEELGSELGERAMAATRQVVSQQSVQRKRLMQRLKEGFGSCVQATVAWRRLVSDLTHPRAVFHFPKFYPSSWELDPTEGPARVRVRMRRTNLDIDQKFFKPEFCQSSCNCETQSPLGYLFEDSRLPLSAVVVERLHSNIKVRHMCQASLITPQCQTQGELLIANSAVYFVPSHHDHSQMIGGGCENVSQEWSLDQIKEIHRRRFELQERAIEIFLLNGRTHLVALNSTKERDEVMEVISGAELGSRVASEPLTQAVELWRDGFLTNWQYLVILNTMAGRTYNDLMQYPVFPFVLSDYTSPHLDLADSKSYRNFKKPMAIQDKKNEQHYIKHYNYLKGEMAKGSLSHPQEPYHYSSHYSNSVTVLHFLVRVPPYTAMFLKYQDDSFDWPDRTFHSVQTTWRLTSSESTTDVKELIPEFFFLPEFLTNNEGFDFGLRQSGDPVDDVILPPWAPDPRTFILIHRQALESEYSRENLPHWIDLVFGYKQVGKAAVDCINVFHPATYYGFDPERVTDPLSRLASYTMVRTYGQTPKQLFRANPHPLPVQPLEGKLSPEGIPSVIPGVRGLVWGKYVGSPGDTAGAKLVWQHQAAVSSLVPLQTNDIFGLPPATTLLLSHAKDTPLPLGNSASVFGAAVISWGHGDGILRAKVTKDHPPVPIIPPLNESVTLVASASDSNQIWIGFSSGKIIVYTYKFEGGGSKLEISSDGRRLVGHRSAVLAIYLTRSFSLAVTASQDGSCILWDINNLTYIRSLPDVNLPVTCVTVSETLGDIMTVAQESSQSQIRVHTSNTRLVGSFTTPSNVTAACYSTAPEGCSVNVLATGTADGQILLWSSWDLSSVGKITAPGLNHPITSITYSFDSQLLYATSSTGFVYVWQSSNSKNSSKLPKFLNLTSLI